MIYIRYECLIISFLCQGQHIFGQIIAYSNLMEEASIKITVVIRVRVIFRKNRLWWWNSKFEHVDDFNELL